MIGYDEKRKTYFVQYKKQDINGNWHTTKKRGFALKREAKEYEANMLNVKAVPTNETFHEIAEKYYNSIDASEEAKRMHRTRFEKSFSDYYDRPITKISKAMLDSWRTSLINSGYAYNTQKRTLQYVKSVFKYAANIYDIPNPASVLRPIKKPIEAPDQVMHVWTIDQFNQFLNAVDNPLYALFFELLFWTGCRRGEAIALQKTDLTGNQLYIHGSMKHFKNGITPPKNSSSIRTIKLDDQLVKDLQPLLSIPGPFLFGGERSLPITVIQSQFSKAIKASGVPKIRIHDLRHSHATILINNEVNIVAVSKRLGHASIEQTLKTYTHLLKKTDDQMMEKIEKLHGKNEVKN